MNVEWLPANVERAIAAGHAVVTEDGRFVHYFGVAGSSDRAPSTSSLYEITPKHVDTPQGRAYRPKAL